MKRTLLFIGVAIFMFSAKAQTSSYSIPDGNYLTIGNYSSSNDSKGILFTGFRDVASNYFGASIDAVNSWECCDGYPGAGYAGVKHIGLNFNIHTPGDWSADAKTTVMSIATSGNVGIGTTSPQYKLDVKGQIRATEVLIQSVDNFADYVFDKDYRLPELHEVKTYIDNNGHLPEIPSAKEAKENGVSLVDMQVKLLKKVEELMLYTIKQQDEIKSQHDEINSLKEKLEKLESGK